MLRRPQSSPLFPYTTLFRSDLEDTVLRIASFFRDESCGQCVPCRVGTVRQEEALHRLAAKRPLGSAGQEAALIRSEEHTSELQSHSDLVCRLLLEKKKKVYN